MDLKTVSKNVSYFLPYLSSCSKKCPSDEESVFLSTVPNYSLSVHLMLGYGNLKRKTAIVEQNG